MALSFIIIDDSELDCFIARKIIDHADKKLKVTTFLNANDALELIKNSTTEHSSDGTITIILLDLQMPLMNGFQFVEEFEKFPVEIQKEYVVVVLSSTRNTNDIFRIFTYNAVHSLMEKPLTREKLLALIQQVSSAPPI